MGRRLALLTIICSLGAVTQTHATTYDPMVAFICNRGAMHMTPQLGWRSDSRTNCVESKSQILKYCKAMYPGLDVRNIVETSDHMTIKGWCPLGVIDCPSPDTFKVQPYRCLVGPFKSDGLVVPSGCVFDQMRVTGRCSDYADWRHTAAVSCLDKHTMQMESLAMVNPCGTDLFSGVEFVCCPKAAKNRTTPALAPGEPKISVKISSAGQLPPGDIVSRYFHLPMSAGQYKNEHDIYRLVKKQLVGRNHDKVTKLMKELSEARDRVAELKKTDPRGAAKMNAEISARFAKENAALQSELDSENLQMDAVHQQHVQTSLNNRKRTSMQKFVSELRPEVYNVETISSLLKKYITIERKDADHCVNHFVKVRSRDPSAASEMLPTTIEHLTLISTRINQSIEMLDMLHNGTVVDKLKRSVRGWLEQSFTKLEKLIHEFTLLREQTKHTQQVEQTRPTEHRETVVPHKKVTTYKAYAQRLSQTNFVKTSSKADGSNARHEYSSNVLKVDNSHKSDVNAQVQKEPRPNGVRGSMSAGAAIATASGVIIAMMVVVFAVLIVKKRSHSKRPMYLEVADYGADISPEDRHIVAMQNGYENPTYKLLEQRT